MSVVLRALERRSVLPGPWDGSALAVPAPGAGGRMSTAGKTVSESTSLGMMTLFAGVRIISDTVSSTPLRAVTINPDGTRKPVVPSPGVITDPFMAFTLQEGVSQIVTSLLLRGNAYLFVTERDPKTFKPSSLRILHPDQVQVSWDTNGFRAYKVNSRAVQSSEMVHLTGFMLANSLKGAGIIEYCRNALGIGIALEDVAGQFFQNGIMASGIISTETPLTDDQSRQAAELFSSRHAGSDRAFKPVVLGGGAKFQPISLTLEDAQFLQSRQWSESQVATLLGIPPHLLGIVDRTTSWGTGIEVQGRAFVDYTLRSFYVRLATMFTGFLPDGMFSDFLTDVITRADTATRFDNYMKALGANNGIGWMNRDEVRALEGLPPLPNGEGQAYFVAATSVSSIAPPPVTEPTNIPPNDPSTGASNGHSND